jgi:phosphoglycolate phosphatase
VKRPKALLLDLDGTLVDSRDDIATSLNAALAVHRIPPLELSRVYPMIGDGARVLVTRALAAAGSNAPIDDVLATFQSRYADEPCVHTKLIDGANRDVTFSGTVEDGSGNRRVETAGDGCCEGENR